MTASVAVLFVASMMLTAWFIRLLGGGLARTWRLIDNPGGRKRHLRPVPLVGGLGMALGVLALAPMWMSLGARHVWLGGLLLLAALAGALDDRHQLRARAKLIPQAVLALLVVYGAGLHFASLGEILGDEPLLLGAASGAFTLFAIVGTINTTNMADGLDGLAGGYAAIALAGLLAVAIWAGRAEETRLIVTLLGALAGFLIYNLRTPWRHSASVFMGDAGSMVLGLAIPWLVLSLSAGPRPAMPPVLGALFFAIPMFDILATLVRRLLGRHHLCRADRRHIHYRLRDAGWSTRRVVFTLLAASLTAAAGGLLAWRAGWDEQQLFRLFIGLFMVFMLVVLVTRRDTKLEGLPPEHVPAVDG